MGVLIAAWTLRAEADTYAVTAKVPAPALTEGAIIASPTDGSTFTASPITVSGTCPNNSYVSLIRNGAFSGVAWCASDNTFTISTGLSAGANALQAQDYNITDDPGPVTPGITVTYNPPAPPAASTRPGPSQTTTVTEPLLLTSSFRFQAFTAHRTFSWTINIGGGNAPFRLHTSWGDKTTTDYTYAAPGNATVSHTYSRPGYFPITLALSDSTGATTVLQLAALIQTPGAGGASFPGATSPASTPSNLLQAVSGIGNGWLLLAWPSYLVALLMVVSFWLGERQMIRSALANRTLPRTAALARQRK